MAKEDSFNKDYYDLNTFGFIEKLKKQIHETLDRILNKYKNIELEKIIYPSIKELVINATKANIKRIVFAEHDLDIDDPDDWVKGSGLLKDTLREEYIAQFAKKARTLNFKVKIRYIYNSKGMRIEVINNTPIPKIDEERMRVKLSVAMKYDSLAKYYLDNFDNVEGAGIGLAMLIILLKNNGFDPKYLRIGSHGDETVARIEIPFSDKYIPYRDAQHKEKLKQDTTLIKGKAKK